MAKKSFKNIFLEKYFPEGISRQIKRRKELEKKFKR